MYFAMSHDPSLPQVNGYFRDPESAKEAGFVEIQRGEVELHDGLGNEAV
jgi:hypothetical protein